MGRSWEGSPKFWGVGGGRCLLSGALLGPSVRWWSWAVGLRSEGGMLWEACGADRDVAEMWALAFFF